jgi:3-hydroxyacyl-CoA dehydrogenase
MTNLDFDSQYSVCGSGTMGHGIAENLAIIGKNVVLYDISNEALKKAKKEIEYSLRILRKKRKIKENPKVVVNRINFSTDLSETVKFKNVIFEAIPEIINLKIDFFKKIQMINPNALICSNTSYLDINKLAISLKRPENLIGMHFFNPVVLKKALEIVPSKFTNEKWISFVKELSKKLKKLPVICNNSPGFIVNRVISPVQVLLCNLVQKEIIKPEEFDTKMKNMGMAQGAFETMDFVGLDIAVHGMNYMGDNFNRDYLPPKWLVNKIEKNQLGKKTGKGIYDWTEGVPKIDLSRETNSIEVIDIMFVQINEATKVLMEGITDSPKKIDMLIKNSTSNPMGIFGLLKKLGPEKIARRCQYFSDLLNMDIFKPTKLLMEWKNSKYIQKKKMNTPTNYI